MQNYLIRGILMILLGVLTYMLIIMYFYYYYNNELLDITNKDKYRVFGPSSIIIMLIIINFFTIMYSFFLSATYIESTFEMEDIKSKIKNKCVEYHEFSNIVSKNIKSKFRKLKNGF